jgi:peptidoglycan/xylan/chitin deacetylase (PgdA/CDA1 family)
MYLVKAPWWLRKIYPPGVTWKISTERKEVYLTFDDGPHPTITPFVLQCLQQHNAKATFFCIGKNVKQYPEVFQQVVDAGHSVGNHTYNHLNGWKTGDSIYLKNIVLAQQVISSKLFRPPYGRIARSQVKQLLPDFKIIMWNVLSGDFDEALSPQKCLHHVTANAGAGSIIVFHDSEKALPRLEYALPKVLEFFSENGYEMKALEE